MYVTRNPAGGLMTSFLEQWNDPSIDIDPTTPGLDYDAYFQEQADRCARAAAVARIAAGFKRRLGEDATSDELAHDKKLSKKTAARFESACVAQWGGDTDTIAEYLKDDA